MFFAEIFKKVLFFKKNHIIVWIHGTYIFYPEHFCLRFVTVFFSIFCMEYYLIPYIIIWVLLLNIWTHRAFLLSPLHHGTGLSIMVIVFEEVFTFVTLTMFEINLWILIRMANLILNKNIWYSINLSATWLLNFKSICKFTNIGVAVFILRFDSIHCYENLGER